jgi:hypothetical protein
MATISAKELAVKLDTDPRTVRKFLRSHMEETPGKGARYAIEAKQVRSLASAFKKWDAARQVAETDETEEVEVEVEVEDAD